MSELLDRMRHANEFRRSCAAHGMHTNAVLTDAQLVASARTRAAASAAAIARRADAARVRQEASAGAPRKPLPTPPGQLDARTAERLRARMVEAAFGKFL